MQLHQSYKLPSHSSTSEFWKYCGSWLVDEECQQPQDINHFKKNAACHYYTLGIFCFLLWLTGHTPVPVPVPATEIYFEKSLIYLLWGKPTRKRSYFSHTEHLSTRMEEGTQSFNQQSGKNKLLSFFRECQILSAGTDIASYRRVICVMAHEWRGNIVGN